MGRRFGGKEVAQVDFIRPSLRLHSDVTFHSDFQFDLSAIPLRFHFDATSVSLRFYLELTSTSLRCPPISLVFHFHATPMPHRVDLCVILN